MSPIRDAGAVAVLGTGQMGGALASALVRAGWSVTAWNRSADKVAPLVAMGASAESTAAAAVTRGDYVIVALVDYAALEDQLDDKRLLDALAGRTMINLVTGTPSHARAIAQRVLAAGGEYLDGTIGCYPDAIGTDKTYIACAGSESTYMDALPLLRVLGSDVRRVGPDPGVANAIVAASAATHAATLVTAFESAAYARAYEVDFAAFSAEVAHAAELAGPYLRALEPKLASGNWTAELATLDVYIRLMAETRADMASLGIESSMVDTALALMRSAEAAGGGGKEFGWMIEFFRKRVGSDGPI